MAFGNLSFICFGFRTKRRNLRAVILALAAASLTGCDENGGTAFAPLFITANQQERMHEFGTLVVGETSASEKTHFALSNHPTDGSMPDIRWTSANIQGENRTSFGVAPGNMNQPMFVSINVAAELVCRPDEAGPLTAVFEPARSSVRLFRASVELKCHGIWLDPKPEGSLVDFWHSGAPPFGLAGPLRFPDTTVGSPLITNEPLIIFNGNDYPIEILIEFHEGGDPEIWWTDPRFPPPVVIIHPSETVTIDLNFKPSDAETFKRTVRLKWRRDGSNDTFQERSFATKGTGIR